MSEVKTDKISSVSTNGDITLDPDGTGDTIIASGNVGIGTSTVDSALHIEQNASGVTETSGSTLKIHNTNASGRSKISLHNSAETASGSIYYDTDSGMLALQGDTGAGVVIHTSGNNERVRVDTSGRMLVNTTSTIASATGAKVHIEGASSTAANFRNTGSGAQVISVWNAGTSGTRYLLWFESSAGRSNVGSITSNGTSTSYNTSSDHRLKENVADMTGAIARVKQLAPKRFNFIADDSVTVDGFLAHEAQTVVPEAVHGTHNEVDADGNAVMQGIDQSKLVPLLTAALKESITKIETLETEMTALKARVTALENA